MNNRSKSPTKVKSSILKTDIFSLRERMFNDENLKFRIAFINNRIPISNNQKDINLNKQILNTKITARKKVTQFIYNQMDNENVHLLKKIKNIATRSKTPNKLDSNSFEKNERRRTNIIKSNKEIRKLNTKSINEQNTSMYSRLTRLHSPLSKKKMLEDFEKHEKWVNNSKNLKGFSNGVNKRMEKLITPYLPRLSPRANGLRTQNKAATMLSPKSSGYGKLTKSTSMQLKLNTQKINYKPVKNKPNTNYSSLYSSL